MGKRIVFSNPRRTMPVTVTGQQCSLDCSHCGGHYLKHMVPIESAGTQYLGAEVTSYLVSGGCNRDGTVPLLVKFEDIERLRSHGRLNVHAGIVETESVARRIGELAEVVSFDFVGDDDVISQVYHSHRTVADYVRSLELLRGYTRVVPHICIGLAGGQASGELEALRILSEMQTSEVVFIILIPTPGTVFEACSPPELRYVEQVVSTAREAMPDATIRMGCMRPKGAYREAVDIACLDIGVDGIVLPHRSAVAYAKEKGIDVIWSEECCVL